MKPTKVSENIPKIKTMHLKITDSHGRISVNLTRQYKWLTEKILSDFLNFDLLLLPKKTPFQQL